MTASAPSDQLLFTIDISFAAGDWPDAGDHFDALVHRAASAAVTTAGLRTLPGSELSVVFADDAMVQDLNLRFRGKDAPTNVLSFPADAGNSGLPGPLIGDVVIAFETVLRESEDQGLPFEDHLTHLIVHGLLHLFGYDHETDTDAALMEPLEAKTLATLGIADPYAQTT